MTIIEQTLAASPHHMTVSEIAAATMLNVDYVRHTLHDMAAADRIDHIPARGITPGRYALKSTPAGATPDDQPAVSNNTGSNGSDFHPFAEAVAVATQTPGPDAGTPPSHAEGSGGDVVGLFDSVFGNKELGIPPSGNLEFQAEANLLLLDRVRRLESALSVAENARDATRLALHNKDHEEPSSYIVISAKRKPIRFTKFDNAREAAKSAIRAGAQRAEVFALVSVGVARKGAEWSES